MTKATVKKSKYLTDEELHKEVMRDREMIANYEANNQTKIGKFILSSIIGGVAGALLQDNFGTEDETSGLTKAMLTVGTTMVGSGLVWAAGASKASDAEAMAIGFVTGTATGYLVNEVNSGSKEVSELTNSTSLGLGIGLSAAAIGATAYAASNNDIKESNYTMTEEEKDELANILDLFF